MCVCVCVFVSYDNQEILRLSHDTDIQLPLAVSMEKDITRPLTP
jgi:hypothetical protein